MARSKRGGARPNAGRKKIEYSSNPALVTDDPLAFIRAVMNDPEFAVRTRIEAAETLLKYEDSSVGAIGKKNAQQIAAVRTLRDGKYSRMKEPNAVVPFKGKSA
jgi:hypothetical protein